MWPTVGRVGALGTGSRLERPCPPRGDRAVHPDNESAEKRRAITSNTQQSQGAPTRTSFRWGVPERNIVVPQLLMSGKRKRQASEIDFSWVRRASDSFLATEGGGGNIILVLQTFCMLHDPSGTLRDLKSCTKSYGVYVGNSRLACTGYICVRSRVYHLYICASTATRKIRWGA